MQVPFPVVDLFAGPGGLGEGFSAYKQKGTNPFRIAFSVEKEPAAHQTLLLRAFLRQFKSGPPQEYYEFINSGTDEPDWCTLYPDEWEHALFEAQLLELGTDTASRKLKPLLKAVRQSCGGNCVVIGGPPCQAYSLVGRARNRGNADYVAREDGRHFLYREYIKILQSLKPAAFVMENVKGILSSSVDGTKVFERVLQDLSSAGGYPGSYRLIPLSPVDSRSNDRLDSFEKPADFVVRSEQFGVPQARHRVIVVGIREDVWKASAFNHEDVPTLKVSKVQSTVRHVMGNLPRLRSGLSKTQDSPTAWRQQILESLQCISKFAQDSCNHEVLAVSAKAREMIVEFRKLDDGAVRNACWSSSVSRDCDAALKKWLLDSRIRRLPNAETRGHMTSDLTRYLYISLFGEIYQKSPKADQIPQKLAPAHKSWKTGKFADRFRVQLFDKPSTTITSHISKDGHYFIHPDPMQCRSLTVREAARLQTFPDNYFFKGNRTQQYVQVGNAVPPYLARQIAEVVARLVGVS